MDRPRCPALEKALRLLDVSARSGRELTRKLVDSGYSPAEAGAAVEECRRRGYVNDELLAADSVACGLDRGAGCRRIRQKLLRRGLAPEIVEQAIEENRGREPESARQALAAKWRSLARETDPRRKKARAFRFLTGRGFPPGLAAELIEEINASGGEFPEQSMEI